MFQRKTEDQELGQDDRKDERKVHPQRLSDHSVQANAKPETEVDDGEGVRRGTL